jgi:hypothetical protein
MAKARGGKSNTATAEAPAVPVTSAGADAKPVDADSLRLVWINRGMLLGALLAALLVYATTLSAGWFYDDQDYVLLDPRVNNLKLFMPGSWSQPPPPLMNPAGQTIILPGYDKPVIADRYLWHLSFALERAMFGEDPAELQKAAHTTNICLHLACVAMLFLALSRLVRLYTEEGERKAPGSVSPYWRLLPGLAALIFAVHPWAAEPVCYVSARNGSMGAFFSLLGLWLFAGALQTTRGTVMRIVHVAASLFCALLAYASKENFVAAPAGYLLAVWPLIWQRYWSVSPARTLAILGGGAAALVFVAWFGIQSSERARGLFAQVIAGAGWRYFFEIQSPTLLRTLSDEIPCRRLAIESGYPGWESWACWASVFVNVVLILIGVVGGRFAPILLGLGWYYTFLLPSNSVFPRPDFLAGRNVYLPTVGIAVLLAGIIVWALTKAGDKKSANRSSQATLGRRRILAIAGLSASFWLYWGFTSHIWAAGFSDSQQIWERSTKVAPDHAVLRLNLALELLKRTAGHEMTPDESKRLEEQLQAGLAAENTPTMRYHGDRSKQVVRSLAYQYLGNLRYQAQRYDEAYDFYQKSWEVSHTPETWLNWLQTTVDGHMPARQREILNLGFAEWPGAWWPRVARAMTQTAKWKDTSLTPEVQEDFEAAEKAADANDSSLRRLQILVLISLTQQSAANKPLAHTRIEHLRRMGASEEQLEALEKAIGE